MKGGRWHGKRNHSQQSEWLIVEVFWAGNTSLTAREVIGKVREKTDMSPRMVRVLLNRLWQKGVLNYAVDSYFGGNRKNAMAVLLQSAKLTEEQLRELEEMLDRCKERDSGEG